MPYGFPYSHIHFSCSPFYVRLMGNMKLAPYARRYYTASLVALSPPNALWLLIKVPLSK